MQLGPFCMSTRTRRCSRRRSPFQRKMSEIVGRAVGLMLITGCLITGCGTGTPTDSTSPATTAATTRTASPVGSAIATTAVTRRTASAVGSATATTAATTRTASAVGSATGGVANTQPPLQKTQPTKTRTAVTPSKAPAPPAPPTPARTTPAAPPTPPASTAGPSCYPLTNGGKCYEPGEYCRNSDHGMSGVAGDGEAIVCKDNNGWRWEPA
jgi:hypothetical protein